MPEKPKALSPSTASTGFAGLDRGRDGKAHADAHDAPGADIEPLARLVHVDDAACQIERVGTFIDEDSVRPLLDDGTQCTECAVKVHRRRVLHQPRRHLGDVLFSLRLDGVGPVGRRGRPLAVDAVEKSRHAGADIADQRSDDLDVAVHFLGLDVYLDELLRAGLTPGLTLAVRQQPVEACADKHHDVGVFQHRRAGCPRALWMRVGQQALGHAHRQEGDAALFDQRTDRVIGLRVGRALAEDDQGALGGLQHIERALHGSWRRNLSWRRVDNFDERLGSGIRVHHLREKLGWQIEIDAARTPRDSGANRARHADADVRGMQHAECRLAQGLGDGELIHLLVIALLQVDDLALGRTADQDHREAIGRGIG